jgi:large repetitive protein
MGTCGAVVNYAVTSNDNCAGTILTQTAGQSSGATFAIGITTNSYTVTDVAGNTASCEFTVKVNDAEAPTITCPANVGVSNTVGACGAAVTYAVAFTDNCLGSTLAQTAGLASGTTFVVGTTTNTFIATDAAGNTATCSFTVTVTDIENPTVTCPANLSVGNSVGVCGAVVTYAVTSGDNCPGATLGQTTGLASGSTFVLGNTVNAFTVTDASGNTATCSFTVTVTDTEAPVVTCQTVQVSPTSGNPVTVTPAQVTLSATDNCAIGSSTLTPNTFTCAQTGQTITVDLAVTDVNGNVGHCFPDIVVFGVSCNQAPVSICQNITVNANGSCQGIAAATAFDGGSTDPNLDPLTFTVAPVGPYALGVTNVVLTVSDGNLNSTCVATITVSDLTPPSINCPANISVASNVGSCDATVTYAVTATDNCGSATLAQTAGAASGSLFSVGATANAYTATDGAGNASTCTFTVTVNDTELPTITCPANINVGNSVGLCGAVVTYAMTSNDNCPGSSLAQTAGAASGATFPVGATLNSYRVTDAAGNTATCSFTVTVTDVENPTITCPANMTVSVSLTQCNAAVTYAVASSDNCPGAVLSQLAGLASGAVFPMGVTNNSYRVVDVAGNTANCNFTVTVVDQTPPVALCRNITVSTGLNGNFSITASSIDNGSSDGCGIASISASQTAFTCSNQGANTVVLTVTDVHGNTSTCSSIVTLNAITTPVITSSGPTVFCSGSNTVLSVQPGYTSYQWSNLATTPTITVTTTGYYGLAVTNANGCLAMATPMAVTVNPSPTPTITASGPTTFCAGGNVVLDAGAGYSNYAWSNGASTRTITATATGTYIVTVSNASGCTGTASRSVTVNALPVVTITATSNGVICFGTAVTLTATNGFTSYAWTGGGTTRNKSVTAAGSYTVTVTNAAGCANTATSVVTDVTVCQVPSGGVSSNIGSTSATLTWAAVPCASSYRVQRRTTGGFGNNVNTSATTTTLTTLTPNTTYEWHVRATCPNGGGNTTYSISYFFTTLPGPAAKLGEPASAEGSLPMAKLYPNPNDGNFTLEYYAELETEVKVCAYDMYGKQVHCEIKLVDAGENRWEMAFPNLAKGMYFLKVQGVEQGVVETQSVRFIVE